MELFQQFAAVITVIAVLLGAMWLLKAKPRFHIGRLQRRRTAALESLDQLTLTAQHSLHLVRVGKQVLVLGICPSTITLLRELQPETELSGGGQ